MRGYTLLETVVYVGILAVIAVLVLGSILSIYQGLGKVRVERNLALNGDIAMETMLRSIRSATSTNTAISVFGVHPGVLKIGATKFSLSDLALGADITNLVFYRTVSTNSEIIKIEMTLRNGSGIFQKSRNFYGSAVLRGIY